MEPAFDKRLVDVCLALGRREQIAKAQTANGLRCRRSTQTLTRGGCIVDVTDDYVD
jgi:hypothetical protein